MRDLDVLLIGAAVVFAGGLLGGFSLSNPKKLTESVVDVADSAAGSAFGWITNQTGAGFDVGASLSEKLLGASVDQFGKLTVTDPEKVSSLQSAVSKLWSLTPLGLAQTAGSLAQNAVSAYFTAKNEATTYFDTATNYSTGTIFLETGYNPYYEEKLKAMGM